MASNFEVQEFLTGETGLEPATTRFGDEDSTIELLPYNYAMIIAERETFVKHWKAYGIREKQQDLILLKLSTFFIKYIYSSQSSAQLNRGSFISS